jgi:subtilisin family serine protease
MKWLVVTAVLPAFWLIATTATAQTPTLTLAPAEYRAIELAQDADPSAWAERAGVDPAEIVRLPGGGSILRFEMDEGVWRARRDALCTETGVVGCDTDFCQSYLDQEAQDGVAIAAAPEFGSTVTATPAPPAPVRELAGLVRMAAQGLASQTRVVLVPRAPDLATLLAGGAAAAPGLSDSLPGMQSCAAPSGTSWRFANAGDGGDFNVPLPNDGNIDRGCWEVIAASACETRVRPLSDVLPEYEPLRVLAIVNLAQNPADGALLAALAAATGLRALDATTLASINKAIVRFELVNAAQSAEAAVALLSAQPGVESAQHEYRHRTMATFDDPFAWMNYTIRQSGAERLHATVLGEGAEIAVIDTGVDAVHPELQGRVVASLDVTGFGASADRHGTAVAGIIAGEANNAVGAYGIAPAAKIVAIKACQQEQANGIEGRCWSSTLAKALDAVLARDTRIINMSISGPDDTIVKELIETALARSRLVVTAAGNGGPDAAPPFPASLPGVMAVTAIDARERLYAQATRGDFVDIAASGVEVPVPVPGVTYPGQLSGTSMATASVSAVAALLLSQQPALTSDALRVALESSAVRSEQNSVQLVGRGRIDACGAAHALGQSPAGCEPVPQADQPLAAEQATGAEPALQVEPTP